MWLNVLKGKWNAKRDCWPAVSLRVSSRWPEICAGAPRFYSSASNVKSFSVFFVAEQCSLSFSPSPPIPLLLEGKYVVCILYLHCSVGVTVPVGCHSQGCHGYLTPWGYFAPELHRWLFVDEFNWMPPNQVAYKRVGNKFQSIRSCLPLFI